MHQNIRISEHINSKVITPGGKLDTTLAKHLEAALSQCNLANEKCLIDLEKISTVDSDGVRVLLNAYISSQDSGNLYLKSPNTDVKKLLTTVGLASLITN